MQRKITRWSLEAIVRMIVATVLNKYDFFIIIEGGTGIGKSTLAYQIAKKVSREFKRLYKLDEDTILYYYDRVGKSLRLSEEEFINKILVLRDNKKYIFNPRRALVYTQDDFQKHLASWQNIAIPDEMINVTFNRDFYSEKQKDIIKMINMFRDHENLTIACVPIFANLDTQIKNLCKMKFTVKKRGKAVVHTPNKVIYSKDKWDTATNEKIEKEWIIKKVRSPNYAKLTTFRGLIRFPPLSKKEEILYQKIKNEKRSVVLKDEMHIEVEEKKPDPFARILNILIDGGVKNAHVLDGCAMNMGIPPKTLKDKLALELKKLNKPSQLTFYYWEGKTKREWDAIHKSNISVESIA